MNFRTILASVAVVGLLVPGCGTRNPYPEDAAAYPATSPANVTALLPLPDISACNVLRQIKPKKPIQLSFDKLPKNDDNARIITLSSDNGERGEMLLKNARLAKNRGDLIEAARLSKEVLPLVSGMNRAVVLEFLGSAEFDLGDFAAAEEHLSNAYSALRHSDRFFDFEGLLANLALSMPVSLGETYAVLGKKTKGMNILVEDLAALDAARSKARDRDKAFALDARMINTLRALAFLEPRSLEREELLAEVFDAFERIAGTPFYNHTAAISFANTLWQNGNRAHAAPVANCACAIGLRGNLSEKARAGRAGICYYQRAVYEDNAYSQEALLRAAIDHMSRSDEHDIDASARAMLANVLRKTGRLDEATAQIEMATGQSPDTQTAVLFRSAQIAWAKNDLVKTRATLAKLLDLRDQILSNALWSSNEQEKGKAMLAAMKYLELILAFHSINMADQDTLNFAANAVLRLKGRALDATIHFANAHRSGDARAQLASARETLNRRITQSRSSGDAASKKLLEEARARVADLEARYPASVAEIDKMLASMQVNQVQRLMPTDTVLVEFAQYRPYDPLRDQWSDLHYVAFVIPRTGVITSVDLGSAVSIDQKIANLRKAIMRQSKTIREIARDVGTSVWDPLRLAAGKVNHIIVAPDGNLALLPFATLVGSDNRYLVETTNITYITTPNSLAFESAAPKSPAMVIANPSFDSNVDDSSERDNDVAFVSLPDQVISSIVSLPGTEAEGRSVKKALGRAVMLSGTEATKSALLSAHGPEVLHVATHGFFLADVSGSAAQIRGLELDVDMPGLPSATIDGQPMLRAGILLAGAKHRSKYANVGILSALEASQLDLAGTKMVTLSACQTGVGDIAQGDGVYSMRRSFEVAGAQTVVASLWSVDDLSTRDLMTAFYDKLRVNVSRGQALQEAQQKMLSSQQFQHPYHWAAFTLSGQFGPLK